MTPSGTNNSKLAILVLTGFIFVFGTAQAFVIAKYFPTDVAASFFYLRAFLTFASQVASSTLMLKTFAKIREPEPTLNPAFLIYELVVSVILILGSIFFCC